MYKTEPGAFHGAGSQAFCTRNAFFPTRTRRDSFSPVEEMNKCRAGRYLLQSSFEIDTKQRGCRCKHLGINLRFSLHAKRITRNQVLSWGQDVLVFHWFSHVSPLEKQMSLNGWHKVRPNDEKWAPNFQRATFGSGSDMYIEEDEGPVSQGSTETLLYSSACHQSELLEATAGGKKYLISDYSWQVRDFDSQNEDDWEAIADIQAKAFYTPFSIFNDFLFTIFKAEVLSALVYKIRHSLPKRYTCLLAEPLQNELILDAIPSKETESKVIGVVDLTALAEREIVKHLHATDEYLYLSGLAVESEYRRKGVATLLLQASDLKALAWGFKYVVLHAYEDDAPARRLYARAGFQLICKESLWASKLLGKRRRVTMAKEVGFVSTGS